MITLIHGTDSTKSRQYFIEQKKLNSQAIMLDGEKLTLTDLTQALDGGELFAIEKSAFIENFLSKRRKSKEKDAILAYLLAHKNASIYLWEEKELEKSVLLKLKKEAVLEFSLPKSLFAFLDNFKPRNGEKLIKLFHETLLTSDVEIVVFMLARHLRILLALSDAGSEQIDEVKRLAPWQLGKLKTQASAFTASTLLAFHVKLFLIDRNQKTGNLPGGLISTIDFLLLEI